MNGVCIHIYIYLLIPIVDPCMVYIHSTYMQNPKSEPSGINIPYMDPMGYIPGTL